MTQLLRRCLPALSLVALALILTGCGGTTTSSSNSGGSNNPPPVTSAGHIVLIVLENSSYSQVIGSSAMPYLNSLASQNALATNYFANGHPSIPNYFMLTTGQTITFDDNFSGTISDNNIVRELVAAGRTWKSYAESLPSTGYMGDNTGAYLKRHNPVVYLTDVVNSPAQQQNVVPFSQFSTDLASGNLPSMSFVVPNEFNDAHSCPASNPNCTEADKMASADAWLQSNIAPLLNDSRFKSDGVLIITFDESVTSDTQNGGGKVATILVGPGVKRGFQSTTMYQHQSTLRTILKRLGVTSYPGAAASAPEMSEFFTNP